MSQVKRGGRPAIRTATTPATVAPTTTAPQKVLTAPVPSGPRESPCRGGPLSLEALLFLLPVDASPETTKSLNLNGLGVTELPKQLRLFKGLKKLDAAENKLTTVELFSSLVLLTQMNLSSNAIKSIGGLTTLTQLTVLNVSGNQIKSLRGLEGATNLKALIATENQILIRFPSSTVSVSGNESIGQENYNILSALKTLETVVLSRNPLMRGWAPPPEDDMKSSASDALRNGSAVDASNAATVPHPLSCFGLLPTLKKLSLSDCDISTLPRRWFLPAAVEVRLARNTIREIPEAVILRSVHTLDVSSNLLPNVVELRRCKYLVHLNVKGNPMCVSAPAEDESSQEPWWQRDPHIHMVLGRMFENIKTVDGSKFVALSKEDYLSAKSKKQADDIKIRDNVAVNEGTERSKRCREEGSPATPVEEDKDVVVEAPTVKGTHVTVVRRERAVASQHITKNTRATGKAAIELLHKDRYGGATTGW